MIHILYFCFHPYMLILFNEACPSNHTEATSWIWIYLNRVNKFLPPIPLLLLSVAMSSFKGLLPFPLVCLKKKKQQPSVSHLYWSWYTRVLYSRLEKEAQEVNESTIKTQLLLYVLSLPVKGIATSRKFLSICPMARAL